MSLAVITIMYAKLLQSCLTLCNPVDYSLSGSCVHGISQARILEWVATSFSRGSSRPRDRTWVSPALQADSLPSPVLPGGFFTTSATMRGLVPLQEKTAENLVSLCLSVSLSPHAVCERSDKAVVCKPEESLHLESTLGAP